MRAADAIEKASLLHPQLLEPYKRTILKKVAAIQQQEVRWHVAQILPRLQMTPKERDHAVSILFDYLEDKSSIVKTFAMQALADLAQDDSRLRKRIVPILEFLTAPGTQPCVHEATNSCQSSNASFGKPSAPKIQTFGWY
jgi:hypothetical protein